MTRRLTIADDDDAPISREQQLWQEVLLLAAADARLPYDSTERDEARRWFIEADGDLDLVVEFAGLDVAAVHDALPYLIASFGGDVRAHIGGVASTANKVTI